MSADAQAGARRSPGGYVVEDSLARVGWDAASHPDVALVETARPRRKPYRAVLCQNAWNFIPRAEFKALLRPYPVKSRLRYRARRLVAGLNVRRADRAIVLSPYMGELLRQRGSKVTTAAVDLPMDLHFVAPAKPHWFGSQRAFWLIPGTITWYKKPESAIGLMKSEADTGQAPFLVFAGADDGSGCLQALSRSLAEAGIDAWVGPVSRSEMLWLLANADVTLVPSLLESLSLSFAEALVLSRHVWATDLPVHAELSQQLARSPRWLPICRATPPRGEESDARGAVASVDINARASRAWSGLAKELSR